METMRSSVTLATRLQGATTQKAVLRSFTAVKAADYKGMLHPTKLRKNWATATEPER